MEVTKVTTINQPVSLAIFLLSMRTTLTGADHESSGQTRDAFAAIYLAVNIATWRHPQNSTPPWSSACPS